MVISLFLLGLSLLGAGGVFAYEQYLMDIRDAKSAEVENAEKEIDTVVVEDFIRMRDRFTSAKTLLDAHVMASQFFDLLESKTLQNVRFDSLSFTLADDRTAEIRMEGVARTFNALAAQSSLFAGEKEIKRAIFSDIRVDENDDTVSFTLTADLTPALIAMTEKSAGPAPAAEELPISEGEAPSEEGSAESPEAAETAPAPTP